MSFGAAGWYPDPCLASQLRYWDGAGWTHWTQPRGADPELSAPRWWMTYGCGFCDRSVLTTTERLFASPVPVEERVEAADAYAAFFRAPIAGTIEARAGAKDRSRFAFNHATEALNFMVTLPLLSLVSLLPVIVGLLYGLRGGWPFLLAVPFAANAVLCACWIGMGAVRALKGRAWRFPICVRLFAGQAVGGDRGQDAVRAQALASPPRLLPGKPALAWARRRWLFYAPGYVWVVALAALIFAVEVLGREISGLVFLVVLAVAAIVGVGITQLGFRRPLERARQRERAAGYTTTYGYPSDIGLWQIDPDTGDVVREPGDDPVPGPHSQHT